MTSSFQSILATLAIIAASLSAQVGLLTQSVSPLSQLAAVATTNGLVGHWNFDENSGVSAGDSSGSGNVGQLQNGTTWTAGKMGSGVAFDGVDDKVLIGNPSVMDFGAGQDFTISLWIKGSDTTKAQKIISKRSATPDGYQLRFNNPASLIWRIDEPVTITDTIAPTHPLNGSWRHLVVGRSGSQHFFYIDGVLVKTSTDSTSNSLQNIESLTIGGDQGSVGGFNGSVDEVRIYNRGLTSQEISDIYNDTGIAPPPTGDTTPPSVPSGLSATAQSSSQINLSWSASTDNVGVTGYKVFRNGTQVNTASGTTYNDTGLTASTQYSYTVSAYDAAGNNSTQSSSASATTQAVTPPPTSATISLNPATTYQTMVGWEATTFADQGSAFFPNYSDPLFNIAINDLGINRVRLEIKSGAENQTDYWTQFQNGTISSALWRCYRYSHINDNSNSSSINLAGFQFSELDDNINKIVIPLRQKSQARGEKLYVNLNYVSFTSQITNGGCPAGLTTFHNTNPSEYAEFVLATYQHMQSKYGFVPDSWEVMLEPDNGTVWTATQVGQVIVAAGDLLVANGFTPKFVAPSTTAGPSAITWFNSIVAVPGAANYISEVSYHRYANIINSDLATLAARVAQFGKFPAMLEWIGAKYTTLHDDLKSGNNSSWSQFVLAGPSTNADDGGKYFLVDSTNPSSPTIIVGSRTKFLRQYFKYIRSGAVRIGATTANATFDPVAFRNTNGNYVVVVKALGGGNFTVGDLPAGTYGIFYTTGDGVTATQYDVQLPDQVITSGGVLSTNIPAAGAITIYAKGGSVPPPLGDTTAPIISSISASGVTQNSANVSWSTNEDSDTQVEYGTTLSYGQSTVLNTSLVTSHTASLSGLIPNTTYNYRVKSKDAAGNLAVSANQTFTTSSPVGVPVISSFTASPISITSGQSSTLSWNVTGATSLSINQSIGTITGTSRSVSPTVTTTYTLTATNAQGSVNSSVTITVNPILPPVTGTVFYVSPNGSAGGNGSMANPWDLKSALSKASTVIPPGSTVYLRGGRYLGLFTSSLQGTAAAPIKVRSYPGEWVVLDGYNPTVTITSPIGTNGSNAVTITTTLSNTSSLKTGGGWVIDDEEIYITNINGNTITFLRGWSGTAIVSHPVGAILQAQSGMVLNINGAHTWFMDLEIMSSDPIRQTLISGSNPPDIHRPSGIDVNGNGTRLINLLVHDTRDGIGVDVLAQDVEVNGVLTYSNGWWGPDRGHGHGMYLRNGSGTVHKYNDIISFDNHATGQKVFGYSGVYGDDVHYDGFVGFNNEEGNFLLGVTAHPMKNIVVRNSYIYSPKNASGKRGGNGMRIGYGNLQNYDVILENNYIAGRTNSLDVDPFQSAQITGNTLWSSGNGVGSSMFKMSEAIGKTAAAYIINSNTYFDNDYGATTYNFAYTSPSTAGKGNFNYTLDWKRLTPFDTNSSYTLGTPGGVPNVDKYFVKPNAYELGRANIIVYNWSQANSVSVNVASAGLSVGDSYEVRDAQNYLGTPVATGVYSGGNITVPMTSTAVYPAVGNLFFAPVHTGKEFGVFVIKKVGGSITPPPSDTTAPSVPTNLSATAVSSTGINLSWTASTDAVGVTGYKIYRGGTQIGTSGTNSYSNTGLTPATSYSYTVSAYDAAGNNSAQSGSVSATTQSLLDTTAPTLSNISASGITTTGATIGWTTNENSDTQVDYGITTSYGQSTTLNTTLLTAHSATLSGLSPQTTYNYRVRSKDAVGNSSVSSNNTFTTQTSVTPDTTAPSSISNLSVTSVTQSSAVLSWAAPGNDGTIGTANSYDIRYATTPITASNWVSAFQASGEPTPAVSGTSQTYALVGLLPATPYYVAIKATDAAGNVALLSNVASFTTPSASLTPDITAPTVTLNTPTNNTVISGSSVNISATASDPSILGAVTSGVANVVFKVDGVTISTDTSSPYTAVLSTLPFANGTHVITTRSTDTAGNLSNITSINVTVSNAIVVPPTPTLTVALSANPNTGTAPLSGVSLSAVLSGTAVGNTTYYFYCNRGDTTTSTSTAPDFRSINDPLTAKTIAALCSYPASGTYTAKVIVERNGLVASDRANVIVTSSSVNPSGGGGGGGGGINSGSVSIPAFSANAFDKQVNLVWKNPTDSTFARVLIVRNQGSAPASPSDGIKVYEGNASSFVDTNLQNDQTYYYSIFPVTLSGTNPSASRNLSATPKTGIGQTNIVLVLQTPPPTTPGSLPRYFFSKIVAIGMRNTDVENLQRILGVEPTGYFGVLTQAALGQFQTKHGVATPGSEGYGQAGPKTRQLLNSLYGTTTPLTPAPVVNGGTSFTTLLRIGVKNNQVTLLQQLLAKDPTLYPEGLVTGYFGPATTRAVGRFQVKNGIARPGNPGYGQVGPLTRKKLNEIK